MWRSGIKFGNQQTETRVSIKCSLCGFRYEKKAILRGNRGPLYEGVSKIFRNDAVKITKLSIRPIGRHHPRSSSLPHVETGPIVSFIFGTLPGSPFLLGYQALFCDSAWIYSMVSNRRPFSVNLIFGNRKISHGSKRGEYDGWGMTVIFCFARNCWVRTEV
jgi:hypothetical protein